MAHFTRKGADPPTQLWQETLTSARDQLGSKGYTFATETRSREALQKHMQNLSAAYMEQTIPKLFHRMSPFINNLHSFSTAIDTYVNAKPEVTALLWGSLKVILNVRSFPPYICMVTDFPGCNSLHRFTSTNRSDV